MPFCLLAWHPAIKTIFSAKACVCVKFTAHWAMDTYPVTEGSTGTGLKLETSLCPHIQFNIDTNGYTL